MQIVGAGMELDENGVDMMTKEIRVHTMQHNNVMCSP